MELASASVPANAWPAVPSAVLSLVVCYALFRVSPYIFSAQKCGYSGLAPLDKRNWDSRLASNVHAVLVSLVALTVLYSDVTAQEGAVTEYVTRTSHLTYSSLGGSFGYFTVDLALIIYYYPELGGIGMLGHHIAAVISCLMMLTTGAGHHYGLMILVSEFTTPFVNMRWCLDKVGFKSTRLYMLNGVMLFLSWFLFRVLFFLPFFWMLWADRTSIQQSIPLICQILIVSVPCLLFVLNLYWFYKICLGIIKLLSSKPKEHR